jgi:hypothetical protein
MKNLRTILHEAAENPYGWNRRTTVYALPEDAFEGSENYLLRVRFEREYSNEASKKAVLDRVLENTTSLTPMTLCCAHNFSQPLFQSRGSSVTLELVHKAYGKSLNDLRKEMGKKNYHSMMAKLPDETYCQYLKKQKWLLDHGLPSEPSGDHTFLDMTIYPPRITMIDVLEWENRTDEKRLDWIGATNALENHYLYFELDEPTQQKVALLAQKEGFPVTTSAMKKTVEAMQIAGDTEFVRVRPVKDAISGRTMSMEAPSWEVRERLRDIEKHNRSFHPEL